MDVDVLMDDFVCVMGVVCVLMVGGNDGMLWVVCCVCGVVGCLMRKMSVGEAVRACAASAAKVLVY